MKKTIFVSYSPESGYLEKKCVVETVSQLKENNLADDIWFDKDEKNNCSPCWFSTRMEAAEKCRAAIIFISNSYFMSAVSLMEMNILLGRQKNNPNSIKLFPVLLDKIDVLDKQRELSEILTVVIDLTGINFSKSIAEKASFVVGSLMNDLEKIALVRSRAHSVTPFTSAEFTGEFRKRKICEWSVSDLQEWMCAIGITEYYRQCFAEAAIDGFLLLSLTDRDLNIYLGIENKIVRKKLLQQILHVLNLEHKREDNWHLRARAQKSKSNFVYIIYDPADVRLAQSLKSDLQAKTLQVIHHNTTKLGHSKEEFIQINGPLLATASQVLIVMTEEASTSPFVFQEVLFGDWLGKKMTVAVFKNIWNSLRMSLKVVLGQCPAIDFENEMYCDSIDVLEYHIQPMGRTPTVVLEQSYLNKMTDGVKTFISLASRRTTELPTSQVSESNPHVFISYQWDARTKVDEIQRALRQAGYISWADISMATDMTGNSGGGSVTSAHSSALSRSNTVMESLQSQIYRTMKSCHVVVCCLTPKYLQSDNCTKDLSLAYALQKPVVPVLLRYVPTESVRRTMGPFLLNLSCIDLSNERLYKQNITSLIQKIQKII